MEGKKKNFGRKAGVEWIFPWRGEVVLDFKKGDQVKRGEVLLREGGVELLSPVDGKVLKIDENKKELVLGFEVFEFGGETGGKGRIWAEVVVESKGVLEVDQVEEKVVVFSLFSPILVAKVLALGARGAVFFGQREKMGFDLFFPFIVLKAEEKERFLSVLKLMERPVICLDIEGSRLLLTENKKA